jgi:hypothetical protein
MSAVDIGAEQHPIRLVVTDDLRRSRLTVFFRLLLAIPHLVWLSLWGIAVWLAVVVGWFIALVTGRLPDSIHGFVARYLRYTTHVCAYLFIVADPFPAFSGTATYPIDLQVDPPVSQSRLSILLRLLFGIPAFIFAQILGYLLEILALIAWVYGVITGRALDGVRNLSIYALRFTMQTYAYAGLVTEEYPKFGD